MNREGHMLLSHPPQFECYDCNQPKQLNPVEAKPMGFKFAKTVAIIGTDNPQVFDL